MGKLSLVNFDSNRSLVARGDLLANNRFMPCHIARRSQVNNDQLIDLEPAAARKITTNDLTEPLSPRTSRSHYHQWTSPEPLSPSINLFEALEWMFAVSNDIVVGVKCVFR